MNRSAFGILAGLLTLHGSLYSAAGVESEHEGPHRGIVYSTRVPHGFERLFGSGVIWGADLTQVYQQNVHGGLSTSRRAGRYAGSYGLEASVDLEETLGLADSAMYLLLEGGWPSVGGIDPATVGSRLRVNADAIEGEWIDVAELWYLQSLAEDRLFLQVGKVDLTAGIEYHDVVSAFDLNPYANDETTQFLNGALVNNPTIPFPVYGLGASVVIRPWAQWQFAAAGATQTGDADIDKTDTWASDREGYFFIFQASFMPRRQPTACHVGAWWSGGADNACSDDSFGAYLSASHEVFHESDDPADEQGLGLFARIGLTDGQPAEIRSFWSAGLQYTGLLKSRETDVLGIGYANGRFADTDDPAGLRGGEQVIELYYRASLTHHISLSPGVQYIQDPGGETGSRDVLIVGLRAQVLLE
jgi:porin